MLRVLGTRTKLDFIVLVIFIVLIIQQTEWSLELI